MKPKEDQLIDLKINLQPYKKIMGQASDTIMDQEVSKYPIFVINKDNVAVGIPLVTEAIEPDGWLINASTLEEFTAKQLIASDKIEEFKEVYKDPKKRFCLFVIADFGATFVFLPI